MHSCFIDSYFADDILSEMKHIKDFAVHAKEITDNLAEAVDILSSKLLECSMDPKHREALWFSFTYEDVHTDIKCEPHTKLIRRDSDLRIYCYWKDERIADGSKVLIGRIGRHPWKNDTQKDEKKESIRLHSVDLIPFMLFLFMQYAKTGQVNPVIYGYYDFCE